MHARTSLGITSPTDRPDVKLGGTEVDIPIIRFGETVEVLLSPVCLSPSEQVAWLQEFADQVATLADTVHELHRTAVAR